MVMSAGPTRRLLMFAPAAAHRVAAFASKQPWRSASRSANPRSADPVQRSTAAASPDGIVENSEHQDELHDRRSSTSLGSVTAATRQDTAACSEATGAVSGDMFTITHEYQ
ncbi:hypothetical protein ACRDU6_13475 [Mycolicibacterium sp. ELW1]|uniref:hypothetical protein n=1 Tax=unclassified Mycolicibacterium TaxID=2636767 RepID=UPI003D777761